MYQSTLVELIEFGSEIYEKEGKRINRMFKYYLVARIVCLIVVLALGITLSMLRLANERLTRLDNVYLYWFGQNGMAPMIGALVGSILKTIIFNIVFVELVKKIKTV